MLTKEQALTANEFHYGECSRTVGPRGGVKVKIESWRRNGATQTWKTRPNEFRVPIKYGLRDYSEITHRPSDCQNFHAAEDCPLLEKEEGDCFDARRFQDHDDR